MREWIKELCPELADWQTDLIVDNIPDDTALLQQALDALERGVEYIPTGYVVEEVQREVIASLRNRLNPAA